MVSGWSCSGWACLADLDQRLPELVALLVDAQSHGVVVDFDQIGGVVDRRVDVKPLPDHQHPAADLAGLDLLGQHSQHRPDWGT